MKTISEEIARLNSELIGAIKQDFEFSEKIEKIANHYGFTSQANMLCEEAAEFTVALNKLRRGHAESYNNVKEELADVLVIALQLRLLLGVQNIDNIMDEKVQRQLNRIKEGENTNDQKNA